MTLRSRVVKLEAVKPLEQFSPAIRRWLGLSLTDAETVQADADTVSINRAAIAADESLSAEARQWLLQ